MKPNPGSAPFLVFVFLAILSLRAASAATAAELQWTNSATNFRWSATDANWTISGTGTAFVQNSAVRFDDSAFLATGSTLPIVIAQTATISASGANPGMQITGTGNWMFVSTGSVGITGTGGMRMEGTGTLALATMARHTGDTDIAAGTLRLATANAIANSAAVHVDAVATLDAGDFAQSINRLVVAPGAKITFSKTGTAAGTPYGTLTLASLEGTGAIFDLRLNFDGRGDADRVMITGSASGDHRITFHEKTGTPETELGILLVKVEGASSTAVFSGSTDAGIYGYNVEQGNDGNWYLYSGDRLSRATAAVIASAAATGQDWHYALDALYSRMGELREQPAPRSGNIWIRGNAARVSVDAELTGYEYHQYNYGATFGADKAVHLASSVLFLGGFGSFARVDRDFDIGGDGTTDTAGGGLYLAWLNATGWFVDLTARMDRNKNKFDACAVDGFVTSAEYDNNITGFSFEFGRRLLLNEDWWIEPGAQFALADIDGANYQATAPGEAPINVRVKKSSAMQTRFLLRFGEAYGEALGWHPYAKLAAVYSSTSGGQVIANDTPFEADFDGWRFEAGFGAAYAFSERAQFFYDYEYAWTQHYQRPWTISAGLRFAW